MNTLLIKPLSLHQPSMSEDDRLESPDAIAQLMKTRQNCPYCSGVLLRHIQSGEVYWRCSYCHQETPI